MQPTPVIRNEQIEYLDPLLRLKIWENHFYPAPVNANTWHYHKEIEIGLFTGGPVNVFVDDKIYPLESGGVVIVGSSQLHTVRELTQDSKLITKMICQFDLQHYLDQFTSPYAPYFTNPVVPFSFINEVMRTKPQLNEYVAKTIKDIYEEFQKKEIGFEIAISLHLKSILLLLLRHSNEENQLSEDMWIALTTLRPVLEYVDQHFRVKIKLEDVCTIANMSYYYFSRYFKKTIGYSFIDYVNYKRIKESERLLVTSDKTIGEIAEEVGIPNLPHFYETFRRFNNCSPTHYKNKLLSRLQQGILEDLDDIEIPH